MRWFRNLLSPRPTRAEHEALWQPERVLGPDGLSRFQARAEAALNEAGFPIAERTVENVRGGEPGDLSISGRVGAAKAVIFIYQDGVEILAAPQELRLEDWDVDTPEAMIQALLETVRVNEREGARGSGKE